MSNILKRFISISAIILTIFSLTVLPTSAKEISGKDIVAYAKNYIGYPYVHGASGPRAFDCSGFVRYVYGHFGFDFPNSSAYYHQVPSKCGKIVSEKDAKPGDIVSWSGHVGIYIGDGKVVNALCRRYGVCETTISTFRNRYGVTNPSHFFIRVDLDSINKKNEKPKKEKKKPKQPTPNYAQMLVPSFDKQKGDDFVVTNLTLGETVLPIKESKKTKPVKIEISSVAMTMENTTPLITAM